MPSIDLLSFRSTEDAWYLELPDGAVFLGSPFDDRLTEDEKELRAGEAGLLLLDTELASKPLPFAVSNRHRQRFPTPLQGARSTCVCFGLVAAIEGRLSVESVIAALSPQYANWIFMSRETPPRSWCQDRVRLIDGAMALKEQGVCRETLCPYRPATGAWCTESPESGAHDDARFGIAEYALIPGATPNQVDQTMGDLELLQRLIFAGYDIAISVAPLFGVNVIFDKIHDTPLIDGKPFEVARNFAGHCVLIVGYGASGNVPYFECKDSFGLRDHLTHDGYLWVSADFISRYARYGLVVSKARMDFELTTLSAQ